MSPSSVAATPADFLVSTPLCPRCSQPAAGSSSLPNGTSASTSASPVASTSKQPYTNGLPTPPPSVPVPAASTFGRGSSLFPPIDTNTSWPKQYPVGAGLNNLGNTCFLNSALQVLLHTPPLLRYLESSQHPAENNCASPVPFSRATPQRSPRKGMKRLTFRLSLRNDRQMQAAEGLLHDLHHASMRTGVVLPASAKLRAEPGRPKSEECVLSLFQRPSSETELAVLNVFTEIAKHMRLGRQEDSHEFLRFSIDAMQAAALYGKSP